ncbi:hypothetical protein K8T06_17375 [bacterium]|nr:hypothetical protein [bacterium]
MKKGVVCTIMFSSILILSGLAFALPSGYQSDFQDMGRTVSGVYVVDSDENVYYGHATTKQRIPVPGPRGDRGVPDQLWKYNPGTGIHSLFYDADNHAGSIDSTGAIAIDETTVPWTYYIADQTVSVMTGKIWAAQDNNSDGDIDDVGETVVITPDDIITNISGLIVDTGTKELYASNANGSSGSVMVYRLEDNEPNGFFESDDIHQYSLEPGAYYTGNLTFFGSNKDVILTVDTSGFVYWLEDGNSDGDCLDPGETTVYASLPIAGGFDIDVDPDNDIFVAASEYGVSHALYEIVPGLPPTVTEFDELTSFVGWTGTMAFGTGGTFAPDAEGAELYMSYTTPLWADPPDIVIYKGLPPAATPTPSLQDVPSTNSIGLVVLLIVLGGVLRIRK